MPWHFTQVETPTFVAVQVCELLPGIQWSYRSLLPSRPASGRLFLRRRSGHCRSPFAPEDAALKLIDTCLSTWFATLLIVVLFDAVAL